MNFQWDVDFLVNALYTISAAVVFPVSPFMHVYMGYILEGILSKFKSTTVNNFKTAVILFSTIFQHNSTDWLSASEICFFANRCNLSLC